MSHLEPKEVGRLLGDLRQLLYHQSEAIISQYAARCPVNGILTYASADGAFNTNLFLDFLEQLKESLANANITQPLIIMDNIAFHKAGLVKDFAEQNNMRLEYLPPYSPFLNPIENMFAKWKEIVGRARPKKETELMRAIKDGSDLITREDCEGYYRNMLRYVRKCCNGDEITD